MPWKYDNQWEYVLNGSNVGQSPQKILILAWNYKISLMNSLTMTTKIPLGVLISFTHGQWTVLSTLSVLWIYFPERLLHRCFQNLGSILCN